MARPSYAEARTDQYLDDASACLEEAERILKPLIIRLDIIKHEYGRGNPELRKVTAPALEQVAELHNMLDRLKEHLEDGKAELANMRRLKNQQEANHV